MRKRLFFFFLQTGIPGPDPLPIELSSAFAVNPEHVRVGLYTAPWLSVLTGMVWMFTYSQIHTLRLPPPRWWNQEVAPLRADAFMRVGPHEWDYCSHKRGPRKIPRLFHHVSRRYHLWKREPALSRHHFCRCCDVWLPGLQTVGNKLL